ncbi:MAG: STAS domain-containing protein [Candidatus Hodarchaeales archaeon]
MSKIPILHYESTFILSLPEDINDITLIQLERELVKKVNLTKVKGVIIDISSLEVIDSYTSRKISEIARVVSLMDSECVTVLVGMKPEVAITITEMGLELQGVSTALNLTRAYELIKKSRRDLL